MLPFIDETTFRVIGLESLLARFRPFSALARKEIRKSRCFGVEEHQAWTEEFAALTSLEDWLSSEAPDWNNDFERLPEVGELLQQDRTFQESELFQLKRFLFHASRILNAATFDSILMADANVLSELMRAIHPETEPSARFVLSEGLDPDLGPARAARRAARSALKSLRDELETEISNAYGGSFDAHGFYRPGPNFPGDPRLDSAAGPFALNTPDLHAAHAAVREKEELVEELESQIRANLTNVIRDQANLLTQLESALKILDLRLARIRLKQEISGTWPIWEETQRIHGFRSLLFPDPTPIDLFIAQETVIIAGPNMGGKSTVLKGVGLAQWCLQHLMPVPAMVCELAPVNHIVYVGSEDNPSIPGLSAFAREIQRLVDWWKSPTPTLWLLDEIARGTHPEEGAEIATEVLNLLTQRGERVVCATHFPRVTQLPNAAIYRVAGLPPSKEVEDTLARSADPLQTLKAMMDFRLVESDPGHVPRDARVVAIALGLELQSGSPEE